MIKGFTARNWKLKLLGHPQEDSYSIDKENGIFSVADGVTRDPLLYLPDITTLSGKLKFIRNYPKQSPAKIAADIFCNFFPLVLSDFLDKNEHAMRVAFEESNKRIGEWNKENIPNSDYLLNDFAGCVSAGMSINDGVISWGYLTDCGMAILNENGDVKFRTENQGPDKYDKHIWKDKRLIGFDWRNPRTRKIIRKHYRNNPEEKSSFGVLTGEETAMDYVRTGRQEISPQDYLLVYSDGLEPIIFSGQFADMIRKQNVGGMEKLCKKNVKTEGTLIISRPGP